MVATPEPQAPVLIVGAGPTGLMMAAQLARYQIPFRIIEKNAGHTTQSRALVIQARSLEIFAQMGLADTAVSQGQIFQAINYVVNGKLAKRVPLGEFGHALTPFPFLLILEQSKTEPLLLAYLARQGGAVEWNTELRGLEQDPDGVTATLEHAGRQETLRASWLIGADGGRSAVRKLLQIPFGGETYSQSLFVLDCKIDWPFPPDEAAIALSRQAFGLFFPMTDGRCRVSGVVSVDYAEKDSISFEEVNSHFARDLQMNVRLFDPDWISLYHAHHRYVSQFRQGRCFLAGDAAHIHSPAGAQGMNTGLQDAYNLAWKLSLVFQGRGPDRLLDTYQAERLPIARRLVRTTDRVFGITVSQHPVITWWRVHMMPHVVGLLPKQKQVLQFVFRMISQIGIHYRGSPLAARASRGFFSPLAPRPGDRLPFLSFQQGGKQVNLHQLVTEPGFHLLLFTGRDEPDVALEQTIDLTRALGLQLHSLPRSDETAQLYTRFGIRRQGCCLVRPDLYLAYRSQAFDPVHFKAYLARIFHAGSSQLP